MTDFEDFYRHLIQTDPSARKAWLIDHFPTGVSAVHQWLALIDAALSDVRREQQGRMGTSPRADIGLAASLIDWALDHGYPIAPAVGQLVQLTTMMLAAGRQLDQLPTDLHPDNVVRRALNGFGITQPQAIARAAQLRAKPVSADDYARPGEDVTELLQAIRATDDYKDYHRLLDIQRMLDDIGPITSLVTDADLAAELAGWLRIAAELDPVPTDATAAPATRRPAEPERTGVIGARPASADGRRLLTMSDGTSELVDPQLTHEQLADRYRLDRVVTAPAIHFCAAVYLDGPLAGQTGYTVNELGHRTQVALPPRPGGPTGIYEVTRLATGNQPAEMTYIGSTKPNHSQGPVTTANNDLPHSE
jgi:hypothetical protein